MKAKTQNKNPYPFRVIIQIVPQVSASHIFGTKENYFCLNQIILTVGKLIVLNCSKFLEFKGFLEMSMFSLQPILQRISQVTVIQIPKLYYCKILLC